MYSWLLPACGRMERLPQSTINDAQMLRSTQHGIMPVREELMTD